MFRHLESVCHLGAGRAFYQKSFFLSAYIYYIHIFIYIFYCTHPKYFGISLQGIRQQQATDSEPNSTSVQNFLDDGIDLDSELHLQYFLGTNQTDMLGFVKILKIFGDSKKAWGRQVGDFREIPPSQPGSELKGITVLLFTEEKQMPHYTEGIRAGRSVLFFLNGLAVGLQVQSWKSQAILKSEACL